MNGEIIYFDNQRGTGFVNGDDGNRYVFDRGDVVGSEVAKGDRVTFRADGNSAREVASDGSTVRTMPRDATRSVPTVGEASHAPVTVDPMSRRHAGIVGTFFDTLFRRYADFAGRAARREFWFFVLTLVAIALVVAIGSVAADFITGNLYEVPPREGGDFSFDGEPWLTLAGLAFLVIAFALPLLAVSVRRVHDIGLPGWAILIGFIPSIGNIVMLGFAVWPGNRGDNRFGPPPR